MKITEDVVAEVLGVDDSCFLTQVNRKSQRDEEGVDIKLWRLPWQQKNAPQPSSDT